MVKFFLFAFFLSAVVGFADVQVHDGLVTVDLQSQPLTQVLDRLKAQTDVHLLIDDGVEGKTVSANFQDLPVASALKKILEGTGINYAVLGGENGEPQSIFIGGSTTPGAPPRKIDNRPVQSRGLVSPVTPSMPPPQSPQEARPQQKGYNPNTNIPTGGGFVPPSPQTQPPNQDQQPQQEQQEDNPDNNNEN